MALDMTIYSWELNDFYKLLCMNPSKTALITSSVGKLGVDSPSRKTGTFFLCPWILVCQFIEISHQMEAYVHSC